MSQVTFLAPIKFPNLRGGGKITHPAITIKEDRIGVNVSLFSQLDKYLPGFKNIHLFEEETLNEEKKSVFRYFILPCNDDKAWKIKLSKKNSSCSFTSKGLCETLRMKWSINDLKILYKIPISENIQTIKEYKGFEIELSKMESVSK